MKQPFPHCSTCAKSHKKIKVCSRCYFTETTFATAPGSTAHIPTQYSTGEVKPPTTEEVTHKIGIDHKVIAEARKLGWCPLVGPDGAKDALAFLVRQIASWERTAADAIERLDHIKHVMENGGDEDDGTCHCDICKQAGIAGRRDLMERYIDEYLYPMAKKLNEKSTDVVWDCLTFLDWVEHVGRFDPEK